MSNSDLFGVKEKPEMGRGSSGIYHSQANKQCHKMVSIICWLSLSLGAVVKYVVLTPSPEYYLTIVIIPLQISAMALLIFALLLHFAVVKKIPAPEVVKASLSNRRLSTFIPMWIVYIGVGAMLAVAGYYGWALFEGMINTDQAIKRILRTLSGLIIWCLMMLYVLKRKYSETGEVFGENGRKYEIWMGVGILYLLVLITFNRFFFDFLGGMLFRDTVMLLVLGFVVQGFVLHYVLQPKTKAMPESL